MHGPELVHVLGADWADNTNLFEHFTYQIEE